MSGLPEGWAIASLGETISKNGLFADGDWIESKDQDPNGEIRLLQLADIGDGKFINKSSRFINEATFHSLRCTELLQDDILIARMPDPLGRACLMPNLFQRCITVVDVAILRTMMCPKWMMSCLNSPDVRAQMDRESTGTTRKRISRGNLSKFQIPLPPLPEQTRIANKLDNLLVRVDSARDRLDLVPGMLKRFRQAVLTAATSGVLTEAWRELNPNSFENYSLSSICIKITDGEHISPPITEVGIPLVSAKDVREWGVDFSDTKFVPDTFSIISRKRCDPSKGDVLVVSRGATIGRTCLVSTNQVFCLMGSVLLFRPNKDFVTPEFFALLLKSPSGLSQLTAASGASAQSAIYIRDAKQLDVLVPSLPEQTEIVRQVEILFAYADRLEARLKTARKLSESLSPAILAKAFRGELVAQDPNDEPAVELLKRIRAGRK